MEKAQQLMSEGEIAKLEEQVENDPAVEAAEQAFQNDPAVKAAKQAVKEAREKAYAAARKRLS